MIRTPEDLHSLYEAEQAEKDGVQARGEIMQLLSQPGWQRFQRWLSNRRDLSFQGLRDVQGTAQIVAESFWKWQAIDALYEDIEAFVKNSVEFGNDIIRREHATLEENFLKQEIFGK